MPENIVESCADHQDHVSFTQCLRACIGIEEPMIFGNHATPLRVVQKGMPVCSIQSASAAAASDYSAPLLEITTAAPPRWSSAR